MSVNERRLKIIYDALDDNNNKKAIQDVNKLLKKDPNFVTAKILKGIALYR
jgi:N-terminal acetyltransferase B complex non-catalytic subunit